VARAKPYFGLAAGTGGRTIRSVLAQLIRSMPEPNLGRPSMRIVGIGVISILVATILVAALESGTPVPDASAVYLVAVAVVGSVGGTWPAVATAIVSFLAYDLLFLEPRLSLLIVEPTDWLNLVLFLIIAVAVGRLAALGREGAAEANRRAREAIDLFDVSRLLATAESATDVGDQIVETLAREARLERAWIDLEGAPRDRILADTGSGPLPSQALVTTLARTPGDGPARWVRAHDPLARRGSAPADAGAREVVRVKIETGGVVYGSIWGSRPSKLGAPDPEMTRLLSLAADQLALALRRDRLRQEATTVEVARRSDALKSALLDSVSHDLRTPLASIRATAGNLSDPTIEMSSHAIREAAETIDVEAQRLDRLVSSVLDLSRIESGALQPELEVYDLRELVESTTARLRSAIGERPLAVDLPDNLPLVRVDAVLLDSVLTNLLENAARHTPPGTSIAIQASPGDPGYIRLRISDLGPGVADAHLSRLFDKFYRVGGPAAGARQGMGIGLSVVKGMMEALGGSVIARRGEEGGLTIELRLPVAPEPPFEAIPP
jgi:two-component system, OmpR family, sensor histidine kinase KdpD